MRDVTEFLAASTFPDAMGVITSTPYAITAADASQTRWVMPPTESPSDVVVDFVATNMQNGMKGSIQQHPDATGTVTWGSSDNSVRIVTLPAGGQQVFPGQIIDWWAFVHGGVTLVSISGGML